MGGMMVWLLPPVLLVLLVAVARRGGWVPWAMLAAIVLTYAAVLVGIWMDPCFEDNGPPEYIAWRDRWGLAAEIAGWLSLMTVPVLLMVVASVREVRARRRRDG